MTEKEKNTEQQILEAAKRVFIRKGMDGSRMQEIADEAGINKALLHYYFRSKEKLFDAIFQEAFQQFLPKVISGLLVNNAPLTERLWYFVEQYLDLLIENPHLPLFILHELSRNPDRLVNLFLSAGIPHNGFQEVIEQEIKNGRIRPIDPRHLIVNILSMCIFPIAAKPVLKAILMGGDEEVYQRFLQERKTEVTLFVINALKPDKNE